jgi:hypothetical protein
MQSNRKKGREIWLLRDCSLVFVDQRKRGSGFRNAAKRRQPVQENQSHGWQAGKFTE